MTRRPQVGDLAGSRVALTHLRADHVPALLAAAAEDRDRYALTNVPADPAAMERYVAKAVREALDGTAVPFAVVDQERDVVVGSTRFCAFEHWHWDAARRPRPVGDPDACEIGNTWLASHAQRSGINREAKLLLLGHAFDVWRLSRVTLRTDVRNSVSRAAIERLGAQLDGVLRYDNAAYDGGIRDTARYSILDVEWPAVRAGIVSSLQR